MVTIGFENFTYICFIISSLQPFIVSTLALRMRTIDLKAPTLWE